tara:strand:- start:21 stop:347 length:327 start_codon:yes stop_codon:yes gene_type:complete
MQWSDLSPEDQQLYGNGIGPEWFPNWLRTLITNLASSYFIEASWQHHDWGYAKGGTEIHRINCDGRFLIAMRRDVCRASLLRKVPAWLLCHSFYIAVRLGGRKSFNYH